MTNNKQFIMTLPKKHSNLRCMIKTEDRKKRHIVGLHLSWNIKYNENGEQHAYWLKINYKRHVLCMSVKVTI